MAEKFNEAEIITYRGNRYLVWPEDDTKNPTFLSIPVSAVLPEVYAEVAEAYHNKKYKGDEDGD